MKNPNNSSRGWHRPSATTLLMTFVLFLLTVLIGRQLAEFAPLLDMD